MITREFNLYLHAGHSIPLVINVNQYDRGESWVFTLFNSDGTQYVPSSGAIVGIKSDNLGIINTATVDSQGRVVVAETQQMTAAVGKAVFELVIDDGTHGTANFVVLVEPKPGDNADLSESDISMIEEAVEAAANIKPYGSPLVASTVAGMTDETKVYVYTGSETGYTSGHWYYYDGSDWADGGVYNSVAVQTDTTLAISGMAADAKKTGDEISDLKSQIAQGGSFTAEVRTLIESLFRRIAIFTGDDASDLTDALHDAMFPPLELSYITAVYTQGETVVTVDTPLDDLKADLVVTAHYTDQSTAVVNAYTLTGTLHAGTSTVTASYSGKSATFDVVVSSDPLDEICYGTLTYRDIFITNNMCEIGDFEGTYTMDADFHTLGNGTYKMIYSGTPVISTAECNSPTHSLKCFNTGKVQSFWKNENLTLSSGSKFLVCADVNCSRYTGGSIGTIFNTPILNAVDKISAVVQSTTSGFQPVTVIATLTANRSDYCLYIGVNGSAGNADCYIDDVVVTPLPDGMTAEEAQAAYEQYVSIIRGE